MNTTAALLSVLTRHGLKQIEIARRTGIPQPRLSRWSKGAPQAVDDALKLKALADELGEPPTPEREAEHAG